MKYLVAFWVVLLIALHQDFWFWKDGTLVGGLIPIGLFYHACYAVAASFTMLLLVKTMWPKHLDEDEAKEAAATSAPAPAGAPVAAKSQGAAK